MFDLSILKLSGALAQHSSARHTLVAENVANADTPGYLARDLDKFSSAYDGSLRPVQTAVTRPGHFGTSEARVGFAIRELSAFGSEQPNGNTVTLEDQMVRSAEARHSHELAMGIYSKSLEILRMSLGRG